MNANPTLPTFGFSKLQITQLTEIAKKYFAKLSFLPVEDIKSLSESHIDVVLINMEVMTTDDFCGLKNKKQIWVSKDIRIAYDAWNNEAIQFLLYPFEPQRVEVVLKQAMILLQPQKTILYGQSSENTNQPSASLNSLVVPVTRGRTQLVETSKVMYLQSFGSLTKFFLLSGNNEMETIISTLPLGKWEENLSKLGFLKIHKSYIVNVSKIKYYQKSKLVLSNNSEVPIARRMQEKFETEYTSKSVSVH
jgi:two-component system, LytTR family, response regulator